MSTLQSNLFNLFTAVAIVQTSGMSKMMQIILLSPNKHFKSRNEPWPPPIKTRALFWNFVTMGLDSRKVTLHFRKQKVQNFLFWSSEASIPYQWEDIGQCHPFCNHSTQFINNSNKRQFPFYLDYLPCFVWCCFSAQCREYSFIAQEIAEKIFLKILKDYTNSPISKLNKNLLKKI